MVQLGPTCGGSGLCFRAMGGDLVLVKNHRIFRILHCVRSEVLTEARVLI